VQKKGLLETLGKEPWHLSFLLSNIYLKGTAYFKKVIIYLTLHILRPTAVFFLPKTINKNDSLLV